MPRPTRNFTVVSAKILPTTYGQLEAFAESLPRVSTSPISVGTAVRQLLEQFFNEGDETGEGVREDLQDKGYQEGVRQGLRAVHERLKHPENW